ncbi:MAG TPA: hypothetical protein O0X39_00710 [Methanocorpusculum sp.]|nr:hypothetical protein [Methanocorpusculum sp.]
MELKDMAAFRDLKNAAFESIPDSELRRFLIHSGLAVPGESLSKDELESWRAALEISRESDEFPYDDAFLEGAAIGFFGGIDKKMVTTAASVKAYKDANPDADEDELIGYGIGLNF